MEVVIKPIKLIMFGFGALFICYMPLLLAINDTWKQRGSFSECWKQNKKYWENTLNEVVS